MGLHSGQLECQALHCLLQWAVTYPKETVVNFLLSFSCDIDLSDGVGQATVIYVPGTSTIFLHVGLYILMTLWPLHKSYSNVLLSQMVCV